MQITMNLQKTARALGLLALAVAAAAWGPHRDITRVAFDALGPDDPLVRFLGDEVKTACELAWLPDWQESLILRKSGSFNANDHLLFPGMTEHPGHAGKGPKIAAGPYFRRALQAVRTETPENAARWIASMVHFPEDAGSPPHAHLVGGDLHHPMEHWIDGPKIRIPGYQPRILGTDEASAVAGFEKRLDELVGYSRPRGQRIEPLVKAGRRGEAEPIVMECAEECARTVADVLRTLSALAFPGGRPAPTGAGLEGGVESGDVRGLSEVPAKVLLLGTPYSTLTDGQGRYVFRNLPPGQHAIAVLRAGSELGRAQVPLSAGRTAVKNFNLAPSAVPGNLLRNPDFQLRWLRRDAPDAWDREEGVWRSEAVPVDPARTYRLVADWGAGGGDVFIRWQDTVQRRGVKEKAEPPIARVREGQVCKPPAGFPFARVLIRTPADPSTVCSRVALTDAANVNPASLASGPRSPVKPSVRESRPAATGSSSPPTAAPAGTPAPRPADPPIAASGPAGVLPPRAWVAIEIDLAGERPRTGPR